MTFRDLQFSIYTFIFIPFLLDWHLIVIRNSLSLFGTDWETAKQNKQKGCKSLAFNYLWLIYEVSGMKREPRGRESAAHAWSVLQK